jgi:hypothetical protein
MPASTACVWCGTVGLVRWEHVIRGADAERVFTCAHCERSWTERQPAAPLPRARRRAADDKPRRPRS